MIEQRLKIGQLEIPHKLILAPMCGLTLKPFRQICKEQGAGLVMNMMVSAKALTMGDKKTRHILEYENSERPVGMQVFGNEENVLAEAAGLIEATGADLIDLNLGCPAKKIVNDGGGSALLQDEEKLGRIFRKMRAAIKKVPFTIKMRAGWDAENRNAIRVAQIAEKEGVDAVTIHARTRAQGYSGKADWSYIKHLKEVVSIPVIGNGDIENGDDARRMIAETGCDAVMTGRAAIEMPWIFNEFLSGQSIVFSSAELKEMILRQYDYFMVYFGFDGGIKMMRKHLCSYTKGMRGGSEFRNELVRMTDWNMIKTKIDGFFVE